MSFQRTLRINQAHRAAGDLSSEIAIAISSEEPYQRWFGIEILSHDSASVDLSRLSDGRHPLLLNHCTDDQIGVITSVSLDADRVLRGEEKSKESSKASGATGIDKRHVQSACESLADISSDVGTLHQILSVLERLTAAVESIATQPKAEPDGEYL